VFAVGDCIRGTGWAHQAAAEGALVADIVTGIAHDGDLHLVPHCCYTQPEIASVGHSERASQWAGLETRTGLAHFHANCRAAATGKSAGFVKIIADAVSDKIVGCQIIGPHAGELINEVVLAMRGGLTARELSSTMYAYPTFSEALAEAARRAQGAGSSDTEVI
jgi:dihydrolipoamide dehydrogenase